MATVTGVLLGASAACLALFLYPYLIYPLLLRLLSKRAITKTNASLSTSLLFCAYNEIECLPAKLINLRELKAANPGLEILVYDDSSSDGTHELLMENADLLTLLKGAGRTGKAAGMKKLAAAASGDILIFTDANIIISTDAIDRLLPYYSDAEVGGVCCTIKMATAAGSSTSEVGADYVAIDDRLQRLESETGNVMGATGGLFSVRRKLYPEFPDTVQDDFTVSMSVIFQGRRLVKAIDVIGFERVVARSDEEFRRKVRIGARAYHTHTFMLPAIRKMTGRDLFKYISRKVLRWYGGLFLILSGVFALAAAATVWIALAVILVVGVLAAGAFSLLATAGPLAKAREILKAILATLLGVIRGMRGQTFATWAPAKSR